MKVFREIFKGHGNLVRARSEKTRANIAASLRKEEAEPVEVGLFQMKNTCGGEVAKKANLARMLQAVREAASEGARILTFPEMCLPGYFTPISGTAEEAQRENHALADVVGQSPYLEALQGAAAEARIVLAFGFCERDTHNCFNAIGVVDADGAWLGTRRKAPLYPWPWETESFNEPGPDERSAVFKTKYAVVGVSNCFDGEFPESIRRMRFAGAEILLWCNAGVGDPHLGTSNRLHHSGAHAMANKMPVVCCNCVAENTSGTSLIVSHNGEPLVILPPGEEGLAMATLNLADTGQWEPWRSRVDRRGYPDGPPTGEPRR